MLSEPPSSEGEDGLAGGGETPSVPEKGPNREGFSGHGLGLAKFALSAQYIPAR